MGGGSSPTLTNGAAHVLESGVLIGDSSQNVSLGTTAAYEDMASGAKSVTITNYHATQHAWAQFGTTSESAATIVGTTGAETGVIIPAGKSITLAEPSGKGRLAYIASGAATTINVAQSA